MNKISLHVVLFGDKVVYVGNNRETAKEVFLKLTKIPFAIPKWLETDEQTVVDLPQSEE